MSPLFSLPPSLLKCLFVFDINLLLFHIPFGFHCFGTESKAACFGCKKKNTTNWCVKKLNGSEYFYSDMLIMAILFSFANKN